MSEEKKQQVLALGRMGWSLRHIQRATHIRRETAAYLKAAGIAIRAPVGWGHREPSKPANEVTTDFGAGSGIKTWSRRNGGQAVRQRARRSRTAN